MRNKPHIDAFVLGQKTRHVFAPEAVAYTADSASVDIVLDVVNSQAEDGVDLGCGMAGEPLRQVESWTFAVVGGDSIAIEKVREDDRVARASQRVRQAALMLVFCYVYIHD